MNRYESILEQFMKSPMKPFGVRELSRLTHNDTKTVMKYLKQLAKDGIITKKNPKGTYPYYEANRISDEYKHEKSEKIVRELLKTNILSYLKKKLNPKAIVLFGSIQKGTYTDKSDIDLFIQGKEKKIDITRFEKKFGREIQ